MLLQYHQKSLGPQCVCVRVITGILSTGERMRMNTEEGTRISKNIYTIVTNQIIHGKRDQFLPNEYMQKNKQAINWSLL
jgi:hypothetical protein